MLDLLPAGRSLNYMQEHDALWRAIKDFNELNGLCEGLPQVTDASSEWNQNMCPLASCIPRMQSVG
jgi:hypothetical protein